MEFANLKIPQVLKSLRLGLKVKVVKRFGALTPQVPESRLAEQVVVVELALSNVIFHEPGRGSTQHLGLGAAATPPST